MKNVSFERRKSLKNWIERWRPKAANQYSKDYLFIQRNGKPFTVKYLRKVLNNVVKPLWMHYSLYVMRHWCAIARLIHSKEETGIWDIWDVKETLGHDDIKTTEAYIRFAKRYYKIAHYDWIKTLLKFYKKDHIEQHRGLIERYLNKPCFRVELTGVTGYGSAGAVTGFLLLKKSVKTENSPLLVFSVLKTSSTLTLSFFFYKNKHIIFFGCVFSDKHSDISIVFSIFCISVSDIVICF